MSSAWDWDRSSSSLVSVSCHSFLISSCMQVHIKKDNYLVLLFVWTTSSLCVFFFYINIGNLCWYCVTDTECAKTLLTPSSWLLRLSPRCEVWGTAKTDQIKNVNAVSFHITDTESPESCSKYFILSKYFTILETGESDCHSESAWCWGLSSDSVLASLSSE